jgi:predicted Fe-S protein YdhL (DUF1289 family)
MLVDGKAFIYRHNPNDTIDAICTTCFRTACNIASFTEISQAEQAHVCSGVPPHLADIIRFMTDPSRTLSISHSMAKE